MARVILVARSTFRAIMSKRALYIWGAAIVLMFLRSLPAIFMQADPARMAYLRANAISGSLQTWSFLCLASVVLIGAHAIPTEIATKTIVTLLARPIRRWELLSGKWLGITAFAVLSLAIGAALGMGLASYLGIDISMRALALALGSTTVSLALFGAVAIALSATGSAAAAASITVLLMFMPALTLMLKEDPGRVRHAIGVALDYATPPGISSLYDGVAWAPFPAPPNGRVPAALRERPVVDYPAERKSMMQNAAYAVAYFVIGCFFFSRRDMKLS